MIKINIYNLLKNNYKKEVEYVWSAFVALKGARMSNYSHDVYI